MVNRSTEEIQTLFENQVAIRHAFVDKETIWMIFSTALDMVQQDANELVSKLLNETIGFNRLVDFCLGEWNFAKNYSDWKKIDFDELARRAALKFILYRTDEVEVHDPYSIPYYDPLVATLSSACQFFEKINGPIAKHNPDYSLINDLFESILKKLHGSMEMLILGLYTDAFSAWRTIHESECIIQLLISGGDKVRQSYKNHIAYNNYLRNQENYTKEQLDEAFTVIKAKRKDHGLGSKDTKKFIEYGWLYDHQDWDYSDKTAKLNFRDGVEKVAKQSAYSKIYESASEITHSSAFFFYANDQVCRDVALRMLYQSAERVFLMYYDYMFNGYFSRNPEMKELALESIHDVSLISRSIYSEDDFVRDDEEETQNEPKND